MLFVGGGHMEYKTLNNGVKMPALGFGICGFSDLLECKNIILEAIKHGVRMFDTAAIYQNEEALGMAIKESGIDRKEFFITSKLWVSDNSYQGAIRGFYQSLHKLQLDYIDLYLIHRPLGDYYGAYRALTDLYKEGKIKAIGVSNFFDDRLYDLIYHQEVKPAINQIQIHPFLQRKDELAFHQKMNVQVEAWSPFASGKQNIFENDVLKDIAKRYQRSVGQIVLRWHIQRNEIVIFKSSSKEKIKENLAVFDFELSKEDMTIISKLDQGRIEDSAYRIESMKRVYGLENEYGI